MLVDRILSKTVNWIDCEKTDEGSTGVADPPRNVRNKQKGLTDDEFAFAATAVRRILVVAMQILGCESSAKIESFQRRVDP